MIFILPFNLKPMRTKLHLILLVDDDDACNFFHTHLIEKLDCAEQVRTVANGLEALEFLRTPIDGHYPRPDVIFLDINMPKMNGWDFLEQYEYLSTDQKAQMILIMLSTSFNSEDRDRALSNANVKDFANKYLNKDSLVYLLRKHFPDHFEALG